MRIISGIFGFFKIPIQIALGLYLSFLLLIGSVAIIHQLDDYDYCEDLEFLVDYKLDVGKELFGTSS